MNTQKRKGTDFEREAVELLNSKIKKSKWKRIPGSGAIGTILGEASLTSDIVGEMDFLPRKFKLEAKVGYGGAKQLALKKEWIDKVLEEAAASFSVGGVIGKFSGARSGTKVFVVLDIDTFSYLMNELADKG